MSTEAIAVQIQQDGFLSLEIRNTIVNIASKISDMARSLNDIKAPKSLETADFSGIAAAVIGMIGAVIAYVSGKLQLWLLLRLQRLLQLQISSLPIAQLLSAWP